MFVIGIYIQKIVLFIQHAESFDLGQLSSNYEDESVSNTKYVLTKSTVDAKSIAFGESMGNSVDPNNVHNLTYNPLDKIEGSGTESL